MRARPETAVPTDVDVDVVTSIHDVPAETWNALAGVDDFYLSREWLAVVERDTTARPRYLLASSAGRLVGTLPVYQVEHEGSSFYQPERLRALLGVAGDYLVAGTRRCYRGDVPVARWLPAADQDRVTARLVRTALGMAADRGVAGIGLFYVPTSTVERLGRVVRVTASFDDGEAVIDGVGAGVDAYLRRATAKLRAKIRRERRIFAETGWRVEVVPLTDCLSEVAYLVSKVEERHGQTTPDFLVRRLLRRQAEQVGHREAVFTCRRGNGELVACAVNYVWRNTLFSRMVGLDYGRTTGTFAYFNLLIYQAIEYTAQHGLDRLHLGLASPVKVERGATVHPLWTVVVRCGPAEGEPGVDVVDRGAPARWSEPYRRYSHALLASDWNAILSGGVAVVGGGATRDDGVHP